MEIDVKGVPFAYERCRDPLVVPCYRETHMAMKLRDSPPCTFHDASIKKGRKSDILTSRALPRRCGVDTSINARASTSCVETIHLPNVLDTWFAQHSSSIPEGGTIQVIIHTINSVDRNDNEA